MEFMELLEVTDEIVRYRYYPEQKAAIGNFGEVTYFRKTGKHRFDKIADNEGFGIEYALQACKAIHYMNTHSGKFIAQGINGWY